MDSRVSYPIDVKMKVIVMRLGGNPIKQVLEVLNIKDYYNKKFTNYVINLHGVKHNVYKKKSTNIIQNTNLLR